MQYLLVVFSLVAAASARMAFVFPDGVETYFKGRSLVNTFTCDTRPYGYYADIDNGCAVFHVCQPIVDGAGTVLEMAHFSFLCGEGTVFSQESLTCAAPELAFPCDQSASLYDSTNSQFGFISESAPLLTPRVLVPAAEAIFEAEVNIEPEADAIIEAEATIEA
ncbi:uncharacterized protein LOC121880051 [Homarus americanus]|nr:uncharacterized protein LOC121880051 [Homarus americanus]